MALDPFVLLMSVFSSKHQFLYLVPCKGGDETFLCCAYLEFIYFSLDAFLTGAQITSQYRKGYNKVNSALIEILQMNYCIVPPPVFFLHKNANL